AVLLDQLVAQRAVARPSVAAEPFGLFGGVPLGAVGPAGPGRRGGGAERVHGCLRVRALAFGPPATPAPRPYTDFLARIFPAVPRGPPAPPRDDERPGRGPRALASTRSGGAQSTRSWLV